MALRYYCLINVDSGGGNGRRLLEKLQSYSGIYQVDARRLDFGELSKQLESAAECDRFLVGGGDGTFSTVLSAMSRQLPEVPIGLIPLGTGNDLTREYGIRPSLQNCPAEKILQFYEPEQTYRHSLWSLQYGEEFALQTTFSNYVSFGFDGRVVAQFADWRRHPAFRRLPASRLINRAAYAAACTLHLGTCFEHAETDLIIDGKRLPIGSGRLLSVIAPNIRSVMGLGRTNFVGNAQDDSIELVATSGLFDYAAMIINDLPGGPFFNRPPVLGSGTRLELKFEAQLAVQVDGEVRPEIDSTAFRLERCAWVSLYRGQSANRRAKND